MSDDQLLLMVNLHLPFVMKQKKGALFLLPFAELQRPQDWIPGKIKPTLLLKVGEPYIPSSCIDTGNTPV